jgi:hypothetical protein
VSVRGSWRVPFDLTDSKLRFDGEHQRCEASHSGLGRWSEGKSHAGKDGYL